MKSRELVKKAELLIKQADDQEIHIYHEDTGRPKIVHHVHGYDRPIPHEEYQRLLGEGNKRRGLLGRLMGRSVEIRLPEPRSTVDKAVGHASNILRALGSAPEVTTALVGGARNGAQAIKGTLTRDGRKLARRNKLIGAALGAGGVGTLGLGAYLLSKKQQTY